MLEKLEQVKLLLPNLLQEGGWNSLYIDYETPIVDRLWKQVDEDRVYLHKIYPCKKPFWHKHGGPSAMEILKGQYEMGIGYTKSNKQPPCAAKVILVAGSRYEMTEPDGLHYVNPILTPVWSIMVIGKPWNNMKKRKKLNLQPLSPEKVSEMLEFFREKLK